MIKNISKNFGDVVVFNDFSLDIKEGKIYCIMGPSGCGKTTLLRMIARLEGYDKGNIDLEGKKTSFIFQEARLLPWETVRTNIELVCSHKEAKKIDKYLEAMELKDYAFSYPKELSGGMKQRVSMIRAFLYPHDILLMDEPFQAIDIKLKEKLYLEVYNLHKEVNNTIIAITHDIEEALFLADEIIVLSQKPTEIIYQVSLNIQREDRDSNNEEIIKIKNNITKFLYHASI
ncbi:MAG: ABC transporter ATP-binding protein [Epulopiscium sp.]|nr:ABC transporter ATP-binding protein [Candidatus Epulonipiscium sp.]